jgi:hypothetical protein
MFGFLVEVLSAVFSVVACRLLDSSRSTGKSVAWIVGIQGRSFHDGKHPHRSFPCLEKMLLQQVPMGRLVLWQQGLGRNRRIVR